MKTQVLIIGAGVTGTGLARDLSLRGVDCILVEKRDVNAGASGANHGLLHSGARYVASDPQSAEQCRAEGELLKQLAPQCIEDTGGLFVAVQGDDEKYIADFPHRCNRSGIPVQAVDVEQAREMEPALSDKLIAAFAVADATIDPFKLSLDNIAQAQQFGCRFLRYHRVLAFDFESGQIRATRLLDAQAQAEIRIEADLVVNAAGAWADQIAAMIDAPIPMLYSKGSLLVTQNRLTRRVINRLRKPSDADILAPGGTVSILGTTSVRIESPDQIHPTIEEVDFIIDQGAAMVPVLETTRYIRAYCGVRPLIQSCGGDDDRSVSRGFELIDHSRHGVDNFVTITGGKLTTYRHMAEKAADLVCSRLGIDRPGRTHLEPLPDAADGRWTEPGLAPQVWIRRNDPGDLLLCECEMVPQSAVTAVLSSLHRQKFPVSLTAIALRSRIGKGPCQGTFCSQRMSADLYDRGEFERDQGVAHLGAFLSERWRGQHPLMWDMALIQFELQEAIHCGFFGLELHPPADVKETR